jgi:hypothetical protein
MYGQGDSYLDIFFYRNLLRGKVLKFRTALYIDLTVNWPLVVSGHIITSFKCILIILSTTSSHGIVLSA